jgi:hypothetical protein
MRYQTGKEKEISIPERMRYPVNPDSVQARVAAEYLKSGPCCRVFFKNCPDIFPDSHLNLPVPVVK